MIVGLYGVSLCLLMPSVLCIDGFGELGELGELRSKLHTSTNSGNSLEFYFHWGTSIKYQYLVHGTSLQIRPCRYDSVLQV